MKVETRTQSESNTVTKYSPAERRVYSQALENFSRGETYRNTPDPLRTSLQQDYARFMVECFKREKRYSRTRALRF